MTRNVLEGFDNLDELAGEFVIGTLDADQRQEVERRMATDAGLRSAVVQWQERLMPLNAMAKPVEPSAALWQRIDTSLARQEAAQGIGPDSATADRKRSTDVSRASATISSQTQRRKAVGLRSQTSWWDSLGFWRGLAGSGFAAAAILAAVLVNRVGIAPGTPQYLVVLVAPQDKAPGWVVQTSSARQLSLIPVAQTEVPAEKSLQFWTKGESWAGPVSLGLVKPGQTIQIPLDKLPPLQPNQLFELTLEPVNGSPINRPTGPIQFIGRAVKVL